VPLFEIGQDRLTEIEATTFAAARLRERYDLQRLLRDRIEVLCPTGMLIAEEFGDWEDSRRSIDLLVLDQDASLIVVELKRSEDGGHMELQALRYAAMVSSMTFAQAVDAHAEYLAKRGIKEDAAQRLLSFLDWEEPKEELFAQDVRIVLASADFSKELMTAVLWLNERDLDLRCVRMVPYAYGDRTLLDIEQVIPLPEAAEYQVRVRAKATQERASRQEGESRGQRNVRFWTGLLQKANAAVPLHQSVSPSESNWIASSGHGLYYSYVTSHGAGRAELYITRPDANENKAIFEQLRRSQQQIEESYGAPLSWQRLDSKIACRIAADVEIGSLKDESSWDAMQSAMVDAMVRLERALRPHVQKYRDGAKYTGG
jgi:hypothetical protein